MLVNAAATAATAAAAAAACRWPRTRASSTAASGGGCCSVGSRRMRYGTAQRRPRPATCTASRRHAWAHRMRAARALHIRCTCTACAPHHVHCTHAAPYLLNTLSGCTQGHVAGNMVRLSLHAPLLFARQSMTLPALHATGVPLELCGGGSVPQTDCNSLRSAGGARLGTAGCGRAAVARGDRGVRSRAPPPAAWEGGVGISGTIGGRRSGGSGGLGGGCGGGDAGGGSGG